MKKALVSLLILLSTCAFGQSYPSPTFSSITLQTPLSPSNGGTGTSTSTGTGSLVLSSAPTIANPTITGGLTATGLVTLGALASQAANTVIANATGAAASPTAFAMPSCSVAGSALQWTAGTGFTCGSGFAPTASPTFTGTVTIPSGASISGYLTTASASSTYAPLVSPALTGTPTAVTAASGTNTSQIATTQFVQSAINAVTTVSVAGGSNVTLTAAQSGVGTLNLTGALTANISVIVPAAAGRWTVVNASTGAYTITVKTSSGTGVPVAQGYSSNLWSDGTNVYQQMTDYITWFTSLPTTQPAASGVLWNNGGVLSKS